MFFTPRELDSDRIRERHREIDFLAGVTSTNRSPDDTVRALVFTRLKEMVNAACKDVHEHVNKFIAHAATPGSRQKVSARGASLTLGHLYRSQAVLCKTANFIDVHLLTGNSHGFLAVPQYDQFVHIDKPLVAPGGIAMLRDVWDKYERETAEWGNWGISEFSREFPEGQEIHDPEAS